MYTVALIMVYLSNVHSINVTYGLFNRCCPVNLKIRNFITLIIVYGTGDDSTVQWSLN